MIIPAIVNRRSVRSFTAKSVSRSQIKALLTAACYAPTAMNRRDVSFVVIQDAVTKNRLCTLLDQMGKQNFIKDAAVLIIPVSNQDIRDLAICNLSVATAFILLQAAQLKLGAVWKHVAQELQPDVKNLLGIPASHTLVNIIPLGYPAQTPSPHTIAEVDPSRIHLEKW